MLRPTSTMTMTIGDSLYCKYNQIFMAFKELIVAFKILTSRSLSNLILVHRFERYTTSDSQTHYAVAGYTTVYQYYAYPVSIKSISQHNDT